ncbi:MAG: small multi-drug export protein [Candidatus Gracilibacteria bacterium]|jgi:uncharacterized membrane protein|nr:small multi-drug export protein [Candidatus Gracilibacteria bacterium]MDD5178750.1 small multi-drug export protein [Candidatus Gracilibacteria bacterium]
MPTKLITFLLGATPIGEARFAIPWGMTFGHLTPAEAYFWGCLGNIIAITIVILILEPVVVFLRKNSTFFDKLLEKIFHKTRHRHSANFLRFGALFLTIFIAIPLPGSGGYSGALVAWLFGVKKKPAVVLVSIGVLLSGLIVLEITTGALAFAKLV